jgi:hypothetical protein
LDKSPGYKPGGGSVARRWGTRNAALCIAYRRWPRPLFLEPACRMSLALPGGGAVIPLTKKLNKKRIAFVC